jgi:hypothetical protein
MEYFDILPIRHEDRLQEEQDRLQDELGRLQDEQDRLHDEQCRMLYDQDRFITALVNNLPWSIFPISDHLFEYIGTQFPPPFCNTVREDEYHGVF